MKKSLLVSLLTFAVALDSISADRIGKKHGPPRAKGKAQSATNENAKPIDQSNFDTSVKPSDDFFLYANGGWIKRTEIPPEYSRWGSFNQLIEHNNDALHAIAEKAAKTKSTDPTVQKVGDYYASGMDEKTIEAMKDEAAPGRAGEDRRHERSKRCAEGDRASAHDRRQRVLQFRLQPGRQGQHA